MKKTIIVVLAVLAAFFTYSRFVEQLFLVQTATMIKNEKVTIDTENIKLKIISNSLLGQGELNQKLQKISEIIKSDSANAIIFAGNNFTNELEKDDLEQVKNVLRDLPVKQGKFYYFAEYEQLIDTNNLEQLKKILVDSGFTLINTQAKAYFYSDYINLINYNEQSFETTIDNQKINIGFCNEKCLMETQKNNNNLNNLDNLVLVKNPTKLFYIPIIVDSSQNFQVPTTVVNGLYSDTEQPFRFMSPPDAKSLIFQK